MKAFWFWSTRTSSFSAITLEMSFGKLCIMGISYSWLMIPSYTPQMQLLAIGLLLILTNKLGELVWSNQLPFQGQEGRRWSSRHGRRGR
jgi:hypothetical protein